MNHRIRSALLTAKRTLEGQGARRKYAGGGIVGYLPNGSVVLSDGTVIPAHGAGTAGGAGSLGASGPSQGSIGAPMDLSGTQFGNSAPTDLSGAAFSAGQGSYGNGSSSFGSSGRGSAPNGLDGPGTVKLGTELDGATAE